MYQKNKLMETITQNKVLESEATEEWIVIPRPDNYPINIDEYRLSKGKAFGLAYIDGKVIPYDSDNKQELLKAYL